jgi:hypothetical protein
MFKNFRILHHYYKLPFNSSQQINFQQYIMKMFYWSDYYQSLENQLNQTILLFYYFRFENVSTNVKRTSRPIEGQSGTQSFSFNEQLHENSAVFKQKQGL